MSVEFIRGMVFGIELFEEDSNYYFCLELGVIRFMFDIN